MKWVVLERSEDQFEEWEENLIDSFEGDFELLESFLWDDYRNREDSIDAQLKIMNQRAKKDIDEFYNLCQKGDELVKEKIDYFTKLSKSMKQFLEKRSEVLRKQGKIEELKNFF